MCLKVPSVEKQQEIVDVLKSRIDDQGLIKVYKIVSAYTCNNERYTTSILQRYRWKVGVNSANRVCSRPKVHTLKASKSSGRRIRGGAFHFYVNKPMHSILGYSHSKVMTCYIRPKDIVAVGVQSSTYEWGVCATHCLIKRLPRV